MYEKPDNRKKQTDDVNFFIGRLGEPCLTPEDLRAAESRYRESFSRLDIDPSNLFKGKDGRSYPDADSLDQADAEYMKRMFPEKIEGTPGGIAAVLREEGWSDEWASSFARD